MKTIEINGKMFDIINPKTKKGESIRQTVLSKCNTYYYYTDITTAYGKCSDIKRKIWNGWKHWFDGIEGTNKDIWIPSRNGWRFTIAFKYKAEGFTINGLITKTRNEVIIIE